MSVSKGGLPSIPLLSSGGYCEADSDGSSMLHSSGEWLWARIDETSDLYTHLPSGEHFAHLQATGEVFPVDQGEEPLEGSEEDSRGKREWKAVSGGEEQVSHAKRRCIVSEGEADERRILERFNGKIVQWKGSYGFAVLLSELEAEDSSRIFVHRNKFVEGRFKEVEAHEVYGSLISFRIDRDERNRLLALEVDWCNPHPSSSSSGEADPEEEEEDVEIDLMEQLKYFEVCSKSPLLEKTEMEDRHLPKTALALDSLLPVECEGLSGCVLGVFDGHGGSLCSEFSRRTWLSTFLGSLKQPAGKKLKTVSSLVKTSFVTSFSGHDANFLQMAKKRGDDSGSTACICCIFGPDEQGELKVVAANIGDSRAVLSRGGSAIPLSEDHKPGLAREQDRVKRVGGVVVEIAGVLRVGQARRKGQGKGLQHLLSTSRAFGDLPLKTPPVVSSEPEFVEETLGMRCMGGTDEFILIATDGLWDSVSSESAVSIVRKYAPDYDAGLRSLLKLSRDRGSLDDVSIQLLVLGELGEEAPTASMEAARSSLKAHLTLGAASAESSATVPFCPENADTSEEHAEEQVDAQSGALTQPFDDEDMFA